MFKTRSVQQASVLSFVVAHPGCTAADVRRYEWSGRGHAASYARVKRMIRRRILKTEKGPNGSIKLFANA